MIAAIVGPFTEAVRATTQPCTFLLIVPTLAAVVAAGAHWQALVGAVLAALVGGWVLADNQILLDDAWLRVSGLIVIGALVLLVSRTARDAMPGAGRRLERPWMQAGIVGGLTLVATMWWRPCVGEQLGIILNGAQDGLAGELLPMAAYMLGAVVPVAIVVAARYAIEPPRHVSNAIGRVFTAVGVVVAGSLVAGQHDEVVVTLTRWTLE
ncbi:hypothetical protein [Ilumatobacter sp.]|uniref:hypothetical protein n=1 Tax=Ilumatobacter sp. TaxID=1967498 RepID=UPI003AF74E85